MKTTGVSPRQLRGRALGLGAAHGLVKTRHQLDEITRPETVVELVDEDLVPGVAARARRARQAEDEGRARHAGGRARLDGRRTDLRMADHVKRGGETVHPLLEQRLDRLRRHVAAGKAGAAGGYDNVDALVGDPIAHLPADFL